MAVETACSTVRLGSCEVCSAAEAKYTCPKCEKKTCGLECVRAHKDESGCDGQRKKTKFVPVDKFTELDLLNDYRLLETATRHVDSISRDQLKNITRKGDDGIILPPHLTKLRLACRRRRMRLHFLPQHFERHARNTTRLDWSSGRIAWKVELRFPHCERTVVVERVPEETRLFELLAPQVEWGADGGGGADGAAADAQAGDGEADDEDSQPKDPFWIYRSVGYGGVRALLKAEGIHRRPRRFYELDICKSLRANFRHTIVIEHPIVVVTLSSHSEFFANDPACGDAEDAEVEAAATRSRREEHGRRGGAEEGKQHGGGGGGGGGGGAGAGGATPAHASRLTAAEADFNAGLRRNWDWADYRNGPKCSVSATSTGPAAAVPSTFGLFDEADELSDDEEQEADKKTCSDSLAASRPSAPRGDFRAPEKPERAEAADRRAERYWSDQRREYDDSSLVLQYTRALDDGGAGGGGAGAGAHATAANSNHADNNLEPSEKHMKQYYQYYYKYYLDKYTSGVGGGERAPAAAAASHAAAAARNHGTAAGLRSSSEVAHEQVRRDHTEEKAKRPEQTPTKVEDEQMLSHNQYASRCVAADSGGGGAGAQDDASNATAAADADTAGKDVASDNREERGVKPGPRTSAPPSSCLAALVNYDDSDSE